MSAATKEEEYASYEKGCAPLQLILQQALIATAESSLQLLCASVDPSVAVEIAYKALLHGAIELGENHGVTREGQLRVLEDVVEQLRAMPKVDMFSSKVCSVSSGEPVEEVKEEPK